MKSPPTVFIVDNDRAGRRDLTALVESMRLPVQVFSSAREFLDIFDCSRTGCLLLAMKMPGIGGVELLERLGQQRIRPPAILLSAAGDVPTVVRAMRSGALNFLQKPCHDQQLRESIREALELDAANRKQWGRTVRIQRRIDQLSPGQRDVLRLLLEGKRNKTMAELLGLSVRAIEVRRAKMMRKMKARSLAELVRLTLLAGDPMAERRAVR